jgi:hypothetical protein
MCQTAYNAKKQTKIFLQMTYSYLVAVEESEKARFDGLVDSALAGYYQYCPPGC